MPARLVASTASAAITTPLNASASPTSATGTKYVTRQVSARPATQASAAASAGGVASDVAKRAAMQRLRPRPSDHVQWHGWIVDDCRGSRIGTLETVYEDADSGEATWFLVRLARFSTRYALVPPAAVLAAGGHVWVPYSRGTVERAPLLFERPATITRSVEHQLRGHYRLRAGALPEIRASAGRAAA